VISDQGKGGEQRKEAKRAKVEMLERRGAGWEIKAWKWTAKSRERTRNLKGRKKRMEAAD